MNQQASRTGTFGKPPVKRIGSILPQEVRIGFQRFYDLVSSGKLTRAELRIANQICLTIVTGVEQSNHEIVLRLSWKRILKGDTFQPIGIQCPFENKVAIPRYSFSFLTLQDSSVVLIRHNYDAKLNITLYP